MKFFIDTADLKEIERAASWGCLLMLFTVQIVNLVLTILEIIWQEILRIGFRVLSIL